MKVVLQRVSVASVKIDGEIKGQIGLGFVALLGIGTEDTFEDLEWLVKKITQLRVFSDSDRKMNLSITDVDGNILLISQFTLQASTKKGNRPSFIKAARPEHAIPLYEQAIQLLSGAIGKEIETGEFGADMKVSLINVGPVTIIIDSKDRT